MKSKRQSKKNGRCLAPPVANAYYCSLHLIPGRASELGKRGEQQRRLEKEPTEKPTYIPESAPDPKRIIGEAMALTRQAE
jgi:hypothetical protein